MAALSSALIEENSIELELAMQDAGRHILAAMNPNTGTVASRAPDTAAEQVYLALHSRFLNRATCRAAQNGCWRAAKRPRRSGVAGSTNPDGSKKKVAKYDTKEKQTSRQKENGKLRTQRKAKVREGFLQRRTEVEKNGQWPGPRKFEEWLLALGERVLDDSNDEDKLQVCTAPLVIGV